MDDRVRAPLIICAALFAAAASFGAVAVNPNADTKMNQETRPDAVATKALVAAGAKLVDVRSHDEWDEGHVKGALFLPHGEVLSKAAGLLPDKNAPIVTYCRSGTRAELAARTLRGMGYTNVRAMTGGFDDLKREGLPTE